MKSGLSLRRRPDVKSDLDRLNALESWTRQPVTEALAEPPAVDTQPATPPAPAVEEGRADVASSAPVRPVEAQTVRAGADYPWVNAVGLRSTSFRLPADLFFKLKWLGDTTYGENMTDIVICALSAEVEKRLKERNVQLDD